MQVSGLLHSLIAWILVLPGPTLDGQSNEFEESLDVHLVTVRVSVSTPRGKAIQGLGKDDFKVTEDGVRVRVESVRGSSAKTAAVDADRRGGNSRSVDQVDGPDRVVLAFDTGEMVWQEFTRAIRRMREFVQDPRYAGTEWSVVLVDAGLVVVPFTSDSDAVSKGLVAIKEFAKGNGVGGLWTDVTFLRSESDESLTEEDRANDEETDSPSARESADRSRRGIEQAQEAAARLNARRVGAQSHALESLIRGLATTGRGTTIWYFHGVPRKDDQIVGSMSADLLSVVRSVKRAWEAAGGAAASEGIPVYAMSARGLSPPTNSRGLSYAPHTSNTAGGLLFISARERGRSIASQTGGRYIELNHVTPAAELAFKEYGEAYEITYQVDRAPDGEEHKVEIEVPDHPLATLRYPRRYYDWSARERLVRALNTSAGIPKSGGSLPVELAVNRQEREDGRWTLTVGARTPTTAVGLVEDPQTGERSGSAEWFVALYGEDGLLDELDSQTLAVEAAEDDSIAGFELTVDPGDYTVAVAVLDAIDKKSGMTFVRVAGADGDGGDEGDG